MKLSLNVLQICLLHNRKTYSNFAKCNLYPMNLFRFKLSNNSLFWSSLFIPQVRYTYSKSFNCWRCGHDLKDLNLFCEKCQAVQKPPTILDYFKTLGLKRTFDVDLKDLTQKYRKLQNLLHPDKFSTKTDEEKHISEEISAFVNSAYDNLKNPLSRALHLLQLEGETIAENENISDLEFMIDILERNEEIELAVTKEDVLKLRDKNRSVIDQLNYEVSIAFKNRDIVKAKNVIIKMKYFISIDDRIKSLITKYGIVD